MRDKSTEARKVAGGLGNLREEEMEVNDANKTKKGIRHVFKEKRSFEELRR